MQRETDVLIIGAGPTGLMLACQLQRFNIPFMLIDKQSDRTHESRAFGIQARSMEIFQNLGLANEFLKRAQTGAHAQLFMNGKPRLRLDIDTLNIPGAPFPSIYFLPQSDTEEIFITHLQKHNICIQRNTELIDFVQEANSVTATIKNNISNENKVIQCRYLVGCDGAHSKVRQTLQVPFEGNSYEQEFMLADCEVEWTYPKDDGTFRMFIDNKGIFGVIPLPQHLDRILAARVNGKEEDYSEPTSAELQALGSSVTHSTLRVKNKIWSSRFHLHHRAVKDYQLGRVFIAGDAAHIHTPVGGQGMNTGLQDATNLAWKLALVLQYGAPKSLLTTYQTERHFIGEVLVNTTDKIFGLLTSQKFFNRLFRSTLLPLIMQFINTQKKIKQKMFLFMSELNIHYKPNAFVCEITDAADKKFKKTLGAGYRAPDAPYLSSTLFTYFSELPFHILLFMGKSALSSLQELQLEEIEKLNNNLFRVLTIKHCAATQIIFDRYGVTDSAVYLIRPDGYIGFRSYGLQINDLLSYITKLLTH